MYIAVRGTDNGIYWTRVNTATNAQENWRQVPGATLSGPSISDWDGPVPYILITVRGTDNIIYYTTIRVEGNDYYPWNWLYPGATSSGPAEDGLPAHFFCVRGTDNGIYWTY